jgi:hypothetical protein
MNSVVFRGQLFRGSGKTSINQFDKVLRSVRDWHDGEVILSTWDDQPMDFDQKMVDVVITTKDVGQDELRCYPFKRNCKRQTTLANLGAEAATGDKILLTRTDMIHKENIFNQVIPNKLTIPVLLSMDPDYRGPFKNRKHENIKNPYFYISEACTRLFHPSDLFQCGFALDVKRWASKEVAASVLKNMQSFCCIEQLWCISYLNIFKGYEIDFFDLESHHDQRWSALVDNFEIKDLIQLKAGITQEKYNCPRFQRAARLLTNKTFTSKKGGTNA